jgi:hypothetical protein
VAQFGRGVLGDVSAKLMGKFVDNLEAMLQESADDGGEEPADDAGAAAADDARAEPEEAAEPEAVDLLDVVPSKFRLLSPIIAPVLALGLLLQRLLGGMMGLLKRLLGKGGAG